MAESGMPSTYETTTTTQSTTIGFYPSYLKTIPGILKIVEIVLGFLVFICGVIYAHNYRGLGFVNFVAFTAFISTLIWLIFYLINLVSRMGGVGKLIEFIYYIVYSILYLIAAIVCAVRGHWHSSIAAAAFFAFGATAVYAVDTFFQFKAWRGNTSTTTTTTTTTQP